LLNKLFGTILSNSQKSGIRGWSQVLMAFVCWATHVLQE